GFCLLCCIVCFFFQAEDGIRDSSVTGVQTCALPICRLAAARLPDDAQGLALLNIERHAVNGLDRFAAAALDREMLLQVARDEHRLCGPAPVSWINGTWVKDRHMRIDDRLRLIRTFLSASNSSLIRMIKI